MKLPDKVYNVLKWLVVLVIPALTTLYVAMAEIWGLPFPDKVSATSAAICTFMGSIIGISTIRYNSDNKP